MTSIPLPAGKEPHGVQFRMTISLGNIIQIVMFLGLFLMGWQSVQDRQGDFARQQVEQDRQLHELTTRIEVSAEMGARQAAILDGLEKRTSRVEAEVDRKK